MKRGHGTVNQTFGHGPEHLIRFIHEDYEFGIWMHSSVLRAALANGRGIDTRFHRPD